MSDIEPVVPHAPGTWRLIYFDAPTRGEQIRILFFLAGTSFSDVRLRHFPRSLDPYKKAALGDESPLLGTDLSAAAPGAEPTPPQAGCLDAGLEPLLDGALEAAWEGAGLQGHEP